MNFSQFIWKLYRLLKDDIALEIHLADHCNLNCACCTHYSPLASETFLNIEELRKDLEEIKKHNAISFFSEIRLLGGEPLLHGELPRIIDCVRSFFPKKKIVLVTNGILLNKINSDFIETCKKNKVIIGVTRYPVKLNIEETVKNYVEKGLDCRIYGDRTGQAAFYQSKLSKNSSSKWRNFIECFDSRCMQLSDGKIFSCPQCAYVKYLNAKSHIKFNIESGDFLPLHKLSFFNLWKFKVSPKPFCRYCFFPKKKIKWKISEMNPSEWLTD